MIHRSVLSGWLNKQNKHSAENGQIQDLLERHLHKPAEEKLENWEKEPLLLLVQDVSLPETV